MSKEYEDVLDLLGEMIGQDPTVDPEQISQSLVETYNTTQDPNVRKTIKSIWQIEQQAITTLEKKKKERANDDHEGTC